MMSAHFTRRQLEFSETAERRQIKNSIPCDQLPYWKEACIKLLEPIYETWPQFTITSGYRSRKLNSRIGGSLTSQHTGEWRNAYCAAFDLDAGERNLEFAKHIIEMAARGEIATDQIILEYGTLTNPAWVHCSMVWGWKPRGQVLRKLAGQPYVNVEAGALNYG